MKEVLKFLCDNPVQYIATTGLDGRPKVRPFQFMLERDGRLWFCTSSAKTVYREMERQPWVELCASSPGSTWMRLTGRAVFEDNRDVKAFILEHNPLVKQLYQTPDNAVFESFYLADARAVLADFSGNPPREYTL